MPPRSRKSKNKNLPDNLYPGTSKGKIYYRYRHPVTGKFHGMGSDKFEAIEAANQLNQVLEGRKDLVAKVLGLVTLKEVSLRFLNEAVLPDPELASGTKREKKYRINRIIKELGDHAISKITTKEIAQFLDTLTGDSYRQHRNVLVQIFDFAITKGEIPSMINPARIPEPRIKGIKKKRKRLTSREYITVRNAAPEWFQIAMDISLLLCLGRHEVSGLKFSDEKDGRLYIVRKKVERHETGYISVEITPALREVLARAKALPPLSQYVVAKVLRGGRRGQMRPEMISRTFHDAAKKCGVFNKLPREEWPTFHEIRSLGSSILEKSENRPKDQIQALLAHASEKQTQVYLDGHGEQKWVEATAGNTKIW